MAQAALLISVVALGFGFRKGGNVHVLWGLVLLMAGGVCGVAGARHLGRNLTPFPRPIPDSTLIQTGIYGLMRHPLYVAVFCGCAGWSLLMGSWPALVLSLVLGFYFDRKARREEKWLSERFPEYSTYRKRVKRFIPWVY